ncbi:hypothetical protein HMN09_00472700 [Mycena chlorophos]|uniref:Uncharacterized protein n=1 Tax=Mycena chlorophos TaxID=658473 RepID=A0A8H6WM37_MYCCL|nr:hypothetical protein HMN09_00472700 [Mycena chlorophos]
MTAPRPTIPPRPTDGDGCRELGRGRQETELGGAKQKRRHCRRIHPQQQPSPLSPTYSAPMSIRSQPGALVVHIRDAKSGHMAIREHQPTALAQRTWFGQRIRGHGRDGMGWTAPTRIVVCDYVDNLKPPHSSQLCASFLDDDTDAGAGIRIP